MKDFDQQYPGIKVNEFPTETYQSKIGPIEISASRKSIAGRPSQYQRMKNCVRECINMDIYNLKGIDFIPEVFIDLGQGPCGEASLLANYLIHSVFSLQALENELFLFLPDKCLAT